MREFFRLEILEKQDILLVVSIIIGLLVTATMLFFIIGKINPKANFKELKARINSWWVIVFIFIVFIFLNRRIAFIGIAFLSFMAFRELYSILDLRNSDRRAVFWCFMSIPVNYYLVYEGRYGAFIVFIPVLMFLFLPIRLVIKGETKGIIESMASLQWVSMLTIFCLSHTAFLLSLPESINENGGAGLLLFLVFVTEVNDIAQYLWGKLGKHKVIPTMSSKTWEGLIGGILTTVSIGYLLGFLIPLTINQLLIVSFMMAISGFFGSLVISAVKRDIGVKDTGEIVAEHKGILDRVDSLVYTAPVFFHLVYYFAY